MLHFVRRPRKRRPPIHGHLAWSDRVLFNENLNPFREGTQEHDQYNQEFAYADSVLRPAAELLEEKQHHVTPNYDPQRSQPH